MEHKIHAIPGRLSPSCHTGGGGEGGGLVVLGEKKRVVFNEDTVYQVLKHGLLVAQLTVHEGVCPRRQGFARFR